MIYDVGGGPGLYACWLAGLGYAVHLLDLVPKHIAQAWQASATQPQYPLAGAVVGDACRLPWDAASADAVILFGPLYHLTERADRIAALREAGRVVRPGGLILATAISRFASTLAGLLDGFGDAILAQIAQQDRLDGQHRNPTAQARYFTTAYFHPYQELQVESESAGLRHVATLAIEGLGWVTRDLEAIWDDPVRRERLLAAVRALEAEPTLIGASAHLVLVAYRDGV